MDVAVVAKTQEALASCFSIPLQQPPTNYCSNNAAGFSYTCFPPFRHSVCIIEWGRNDPPFKIEANAMKVRYNEILPWVFHGKMIQQDAN
jgi:hypothetical protein